MPAQSLNQPQTKPTFHNFVLVLSDVSGPDDALEDALYEAGCDDATLGFRNAVGYLEFDRQAESLEQAIVSAIGDVERADCPAMVVQVEPGDDVSTSEIARRLARTREYVRLLAQGKRGGGNFPAPLSGVTSKTLIWSWAKVVGWLLEQGQIEDRSLLSTAETIRDVNNALDMREDPDGMRRCLRILRGLPRGTETSMQARPGGLATPPDGLAGMMLPHESTDRFDK